MGIPRINNRITSLISFIVISLLWSYRAECYTANKITFEFRDDGKYRVYVNYTVPELKEFREAFVDFTSKKKAEKFYWALVRGADFYPSEPENLRFIKPLDKPTPW